MNLDFANPLPFKPADYPGIAVLRLPATPTAKMFAELVRTLVGARPIDIEIDGGITPENTARVVQAGANVLVAGSAVFKGGNYEANIAAIRNAAALARGEAA